MGQHRMVLHHGQTDFRCSQVFTLALDHTVAYDQDQLVAVGVVRGSDRIQRSTQAFSTFRVSGYQAYRMGEGVAERLPLRRGLRYNSFVNEARRTRSFFANDARVTILCRSGEKQARSRLWLILALEVSRRKRALAGIELSVHAIVGRVKARRCTLAGHGCRWCSSLR